MFVKAFVDVWMDGWKDKDRPQ